MSDPTSDRPNPSAQAPDPSRRRFLGLVAGAGGCAIGAAFLVPPLTVTLAPGFKGPEGQAASDWQRIGPTDTFAVGQPPTRVILRADLKDAWLVRKNEPIGSILVQRTAADQFRVYSALCPHLGCAVDWSAESASYVCPCHGAVFKDDGSLAPKLDGGSNPSPRPLDTLEWKVAGGVLEVRWQRFRSNVADKVAVG